jgi:RHS repeat-associated protein
MRVQSQIRNEWLIGAAAARQRFPQKNLRENEAALWLKRLQVSLAFTVAVTFLILLSGCGSTAVPGRIEGTFAVTSAGNASYDIALRVPPGRMGMEPSLRLTYDSSDGSGIVGVGWTLKSGSEIRRCQKTIEVEHFVEPVQFDNSDPYCLDGERLVLVAGVSGAEGSEYRTRRDSFRKIVITGADAEGPTGFRVYDRDSRISNYGTVDASRVEGSAHTYAPIGPTRFDILDNQRVVRYSWLIDSVQDRNSNAMTYTYLHGAPDTGSYLLTDISYTSSLLPKHFTALRRVHFSYEARPDLQSSYVSGLHLSNSSRLKTVDMYAPGPQNSTSQVVKEYRLAYSQGSTSRSLLGSIVECAGPSSQDICLTPTIFAYTFNQGEFQEIQTAVSDVLASPAGRSNLPGRIQVVDIDGDGRDDILYTSALNPNQFAFRLSTVDGAGNPTFSQPHYTSLRVSSRGDRPQTLDFNFDGTTDLLSFDDSEEIQGSGSDYGAYYKLSLASNSSLQPSQKFSAEQEQYIFAADLDGDRIPDLLFGNYTGQADPVNGAIVAWTMQKGSTNGFAGQPASAIVFPESSVRLMDIDGDAAQEVLYVGDPKVQFSPVVTTGSQIDPDQTTNWLSALRFGRGGLAENHPPTSQPLTLTATEQYVFADLNKDGLPDAIALGTDLKGFRVATNVGSSFTPPVNQAPITVPVIPNFSNLQPPVLRTMDWQGDGSNDLLVRVVTTLDEPDPVVVLPANNTGLDSPILLPFKNVTPSNHPEQSGVFEVLDVNGDGLDDVLVYNAGTLNLYVRKGPKPDLLTELRDGFGTQINLTYAPVSSPSVYTPRNVPCQYPQTCLKSKRWVVANESVGGGVQAPVQFSYHYDDGRIDSRSGGFLGFTETVRNELSSGATHVETFDLDTLQNGAFEFAGRPVTESDSVPTAIARHHTFYRSTLYQPHWDATAQSYFVYPTGEQEQESTGSFFDPFEIRGLTRRRLEDQFGNITLEETFWDEGGSSAQYGSYLNQQSQWLNWLPQSLTYVETTAAGESQERMMGFEYDSAGNLQREILSPGALQGAEWQPLPAQSDGVQSLFVTFGRNLDGQIINICADVDRTLTPAARITQFTYDNSEGSFIKSSTDALSHVTAIQTDPRFGLPTALTDSNGIVLGRQYDPFGRLTYESLTGAGSHSLSYTAAPAYSDSYAIVDKYSTGQVLTNSFDSWGRLRLTESVYRDDGQPVFVERVFDSLGRLVRISDPYFGESANHLHKIVPRWTVFEYDSLNRETKKTRPDSAVFETKYGDTLPISAATADLRTTTRTTPIGMQKYIFDQEGRLVNSVESAGGLAEDTSFSYHPFGALASVNGAASGGLSFVTDRLGRTTSVSSPDAAARLYTYDAFGDIVSYNNTIDTVTYSFDKLGRLVRRAAPEGVSTWTWDASPGGVGHIASIESPFGVTTNFQYLTGLLSQKSWTIQQGVSPSVSFVFGINRDAQGRVATITYPSAPGHPEPAVAISYLYGPHGDLSSVADANSTGTVYWKLLDSDPTGIFGTARLGNGLLYSKTEDPMFPDHLQAISVTGVAPVEQINYTTDAFGDVATRQRPLISSSQSFQYDSMDRLSHWGLSSTGEQRDITYGYDATTSLRTETAIAGKGQNRTFSSTGAYHAMTSSNEGLFSYNAQGELSLDPAGNSFSYSSNGLLTGVGTKIKFLYDGEGNRVAESLGNEAVNRFSFADMFSFNWVGDSQRYGVRIGEKTLVEIVPGSGAASKHNFYLHTDDLDSVMAVSNESGQLTDVFEYEPFGSPIPQSLSSSANPSGTGRGYAGGSSIPDLKFLAMGARLYDPAHRRFTSQDELVADETRAMSFDPYAYALNNPLKFNDPTGKDPDDVQVQSNGNCYCSTTIGHSPGITVTSNSDSTTFSGLIGSQSALQGPPLAGLSITNDQFTPSAPQPAIGGDTAQTTISQPRNDDGLGVHSVTPSGGSALYRLPKSLREKLFDLDSSYGNVPGWKWGIGAGGIALGSGVLFVDGAGATIYVGATRAAAWIAGLGGAGASAVVATEAEEGVPEAEAVTGELVERGGAAAVRIGQAGEAAVRAVRDIGPKIAIDVAGRTRIPDGLLPTILSEVKNVASLSYTQQLRDFAQYAIQNNLRFDLYVRPNTTLSEPLAAAIRNGTINLLDIPGL